MLKNNPHLVQARSLRTDLLAAPEVWLPRREILLGWLNEFLTRAEQPRYELEETETADLGALEQFMRRHKVPIMA
jgi:hypothetical protein